ncbi:MKRN2 opposite strand, transcript variant X2 [Ictidomys tridecemlineatus]|uniref:MKRN2 opposite strand protein isoform X2 n=1 Tax=Ictidomys tridecemlineatus TaxID=43179 RepID=UPI000B53AF7D|nr:MKRN2 opposite strand protein isoform X2 [Ictidomys tridecemlineatus]KAG3295135.1 MKRN2 opposite strand, transcript variant X2 [Ictidomys tridecemlineatus]
MMLGVLLLLSKRCLLPLSQSVSHNMTTEPHLQPLQSSSVFFSMKTPTNLHIFPLTFREEKNRLSEKWSCPRPPHVESEPLEPYSSISQSYIQPTATGSQHRGGFRNQAEGVVYNYNQCGVQRDQAGWEQSLSVPLVQPNMFGLRDQWDRYLEDFSATGAWLPHRYDEDYHNCYSYTLSFINCILTTEGKEQLDKNEFTEKYVIPRTRLASKYIILYRAIEKHGFYAVDHPDQGASPPSEVLCAEGCV